MWRCCLQLPNMKNILKTVIVLVLLNGFSACKTGKPVVLEEKAEVMITANSACRNSAIFPLENEAGLKANIQSYATASLKKLKFKTGTQAKKTNMRISKIELVVTEFCTEKEDKNPQPVKLHQKLTMENTQTQKTYTFEVDTLINNRSLNPSQLATVKVDYQSYIQPLTERNFKKAKDFFLKKK